MRQVDGFYFERAFQEAERIIARMGRSFRRGFYPIDDGHLYVTPGVGFSGVQVRVGEGTASEVAAFTLRAA